MRVERTRTLRPPASPDAGVRPSTQPYHHGCRGGAMNQTTQALEHASVRQYCKVLRMPVIGSNFVWLSEQAIKEQRSPMEAEERDRHAIQKRIRDAKLPRLKTLEEFDFNQAHQIPAAKIRELAEGGYIERAEPVVFM